MMEPIDHCRICGNRDLVSVVNLGNMALSGFFPKDRNAVIAKGPLELVKCLQNNERCCGLLQLAYAYKPEDLYGDHYGYRSGLNRSMVEHLNAITAKISRMLDLTVEDLVLDIGSNDGTLLKGYKQQAQLAGFDAAGIKFKKYYPEPITLIPEFFSAGKFQEHFGKKKPKVITSIAMFYDLERPLDFMKQIGEILDEQGLWVFEQSYMPAMLEMTAYDTICHEHFEYYSLKQIKFMTDLAGLKIIDVEFNDTNGGSFLITAAKQGNRLFEENSALIGRILADEDAQGLSGVALYQDFQRRVEERRQELTQFFTWARARGKKVFGLGASTKGNVLLQYCQLSSDQIPCIAEVNEDKFGSFTPGTGIPILPEDKVKAMNPDYLIVLPWHFRENIIARENKYLTAGGALVFPLPRLEIYATHFSHSANV